MKRLHEQAKACATAPLIFHFASLIYGIARGNFVVGDIFDYAFRATQRWRGQVSYTRIYLWWIARELTIVKAELPWDIFNEIIVYLTLFEVIYSDCNLAIDLNASLLRLMVTTLMWGRNEIYFEYMQKRWLFKVSRSDISVTLCPLYIGLRGREQEDEIRLRKYRTDKTIMMPLKTILENLPKTEHQISSK